MNYSNETSKSEQLSHHAKIIWLVVLSVESVLIITCNIAAIYVFSNRRFVICKSAYLLINLTTADVFVGFAPLIHLLEIVYNKGYSQEQCGVLITYISKVYSFFTKMTSLACLSVIAIERSFATFSPHQHRRGTSTHYFISIFLSWCLISVGTVFKGLSICNGGKVAAIFTNIMSIFVALCFISIIFSYIAIAFKMRFTTMSSKSTASYKQNAKLSKTLVITTLIAVLAYLPRILFRFVGPKCKPCQFLLTKNADLISNVIVYSNSFANLFVYSLRMPVFRNEFKKAFSGVFSTLTGRVSTTN